MLTFSRVPAGACSNRGTEMNCRICGADVTEPVVNLGNIPLVNNLTATPEADVKMFPLDVLFCTSCHVAQLRDSVPPEEMFSEYLFYSCAMAPVVDRAKKLADKVWKTVRPQFVIEIASNDGYLLDEYRKRGVKTLGIDPARGPANAAAVKGVPTVQEFFGLALAKTLPKADVIHANNVLAHVPDPNDFVAGIAEVLQPNRICFVEVPYLKDLLTGAHFDTIYHEHIFYHSIKSLTTLFGRHGLLVTNVERLPDVLGGSLRISVEKRGITTAEVDGDLNFSEMQKRTDYYATSLRDTLIRLKAEGKSVWGFGAAAKTTVMLNYANVLPGMLDAVADDTPAKQGKYIPGTDVQVCSTEEWLKAQPDYTCIFTWNYANMIAHKFATSYKGIFFSSMWTEYAREPEKRINGRRQR
jgi:SAM-dependent methyltransferase